MQGTVQAIMAAASGALVLGCALFGPENHSVDLNGMCIGCSPRHLESLIDVVEAKTAIEEEGANIHRSSSNVVYDVKVDDKHVEHTTTYTTAAHIM